MHQEKLISKRKKRGILEENNFPAECLEIEITEYCLMDATEEAIAVINELKQTGIHLAMDDFGTGYSSLSYLTKLPIDLNKIDKSLIDTISEGEIVSAIISMGHALGCKLIAEGKNRDKWNCFRRKAVTMCRASFGGNL